MINYDKVMELSLERGFYFPSSNIYSDSPAGFWEYGPNGLNLKNNFIQLWRKFLVRKDGMVEIDGSQIMSKNVFLASGHIQNFSDPIIKCKKCGNTLRADKYIYEQVKIEVPERLENEKIDQIILENGLKCSRCRSDFDKTTRFNMMFKVGIGPNQDEAYLRPETCQTIFVDFPRLFKIMRGKFPFGVAQIGKSFRNEIAPRQSLLRLREFYQAEIEVFCNPENLDNLERFEEVKDTKLRIFDGKEIFEKSASQLLKNGIIPNKLIAYYLSILAQFYERIGINMDKHRFRQLDNDEKAFYATTAFDFEVETSVGWLELVACNYRSDYDLTQHSKISKQKFEVIDPSNQSKILPHIFELSMGIDRSIYSILEHNYNNDLENDRVVLQFKSFLAPITLGIFPLVKKGEVERIAKKIYSDFKIEYNTIYDDSGSIGRRYRRLDEVGTPFIVTVDNETPSDSSVTIRFRDNMSQKRIKINELKQFVENQLQIK